MDDTLNRTCHKFPESGLLQEEPLIISSLLSLDLGEEDTAALASLEQETSIPPENLELQMQQLLTLEEITPEAALPKKDPDKKHLHNKPLNEQKLLDTISYIFLEEDNLEEIDSYTRESQIPLPKSDFQTQKPNHPLVRDVSSKVGLASAMFVGGFVAGGACSWAVLSNQSVAFQEKSQTSVREHPKYHSAHNLQLQVKNNISKPEMAVVQPSFVAAENSRMQVKNDISAAEFVPSPPSFTPVVSNVQKVASPKVSNTATKPLFQQRLLTLADLKGRSAWELTVMRNEIYARHGRKFKEQKLQRYFESQSWYKPRYSGEEFPDSLLSEIELKNAITIRDYQRLHGLLLDL